MTEKDPSFKLSDFAQNGLSDAQVSEMRAKYGKNELTPPPKTPWWKELLEKFKDPTIQILLAAAVLSLTITAVERYVLKNNEASFVDSIGIFIAVFLATLVGYFSERKSAREFELLNKVKDDISVKTLRNGQISEVRIGELVVGDIVRLDRGDKIPADGLVFESMNFFVDQAMLTGESVPVRKTDFEERSEIFDELFDKEYSPNSDFFAARGTMVADGHSSLLVTAVGDKTQMGKIAQSLIDNQEGQNETPLVAKLSRLAKQISVVGVICATAIFTVMSAMALVESQQNSQLITQLFENVVLSSSFLVGSVVLGLLITQFCLCPFFKSMDMEVSSKSLRILASLPMIIGAFSILIGIWGLTLEVPAIGMTLLKSILLGFVVAVTIIVVAVPEGLPMMVTVSLALNMMKMAKENCLVRKLVASETIGSATVICTDKTGTLTQNQMKPIWFFARQKEFKSDDFDSLKRSEIWNALVRGIAVNSTAELHIEYNSDSASPNNPATKIVQGIGNPTECSLLKFLEEKEVDFALERKKYSRLFEVAHNSDRKFSAVIAELSEISVEEAKQTGQNGQNGRNGQICLMKGAPERILQKCAFVLLSENGQTVCEPIEKHRDAIQQAISRASDQALRVIAFSEKTLCSDGFSCSGCLACSENNAEYCMNCSGRTFVGLVGIADPIRAEVPQAVQTCQQAGVQVKMITGDALPTAVAIARQANIFQADSDDLALTSEEFQQISDAELPSAAEKIKVLARSTPMDKLRLVKALHQKGEVVAMTGDGTNDAPALKYADVGLSMGITGTEVAKEASDIVLVDDNFKSIVTGVWWGRTLFQNIQRFLQFQLSVNVVALLCALIGPMVGVPLPLTVTQLLWINIIMDTFAALALSTDPPRKHTMKEKPIPRNAHIITKTMGISILIVSLYQVAILFAALFGGWFVDPEHIYDRSILPTDTEYLKHNLKSLTIFFTILVMFQFWHKINCRALRHNESPFTLITKNKLFLIIIGSITAIQILMVQSHAVGQFFRTEPLDLKQWIGIALLTVSIIPVAWLARNVSYWLGFEKDV